jgi:pentapeptide MXKDX repeat protein
MKKFAIAALAVAFMASGTAAFAQASGAMSNDTMSNDTMKKDSMSKDAMGKDGMKKDGMSKDTMKKGNDAMGMKHRVRWPTDPGSILVGSDRQVRQAQAGASPRPDCLADTEFTILSWSIDGVPA